MEEGVNKLLRFNGIEIAGRKDEISVGWEEY